MVAGGFHSGQIHGADKFDVGCGSIPDNSIM